MSDKKETTKACSAPKNNGKLKFLAKIPINIKAFFNYSEFANRAFKENIKVAATVKKRVT